MSKKMRLPNGFGQITEIKGKRLRNPFRVMITVGKTPEGRPICKLLKPNAYFRTYNEAYTALAKYHMNPYDLNDVITLAELWDRWSEYYFATISRSAASGYRSAWACCENIKEMLVRDIRARHIKGVIDDCPYDSIKPRIKFLFNKMLDYALEYELVEKNFARDFHAEKYNGEEEAHIAFTDDEMDRLWNNTSNPFVNIILLQCYMGWRPRELCEIKKTDVDLDAMTITGGMKTKAGKDRIVPVLNIIEPCLKRMLYISDTTGSDYLICKPDGSHMPYDSYYKRYKKVIKELGLNDKHSPHDPRKQFVTMCKAAGVDEYAIKRMAGHAISDLTERVYTERSVDWLREELSKIEKK